MFNPTRVLAFSSSLLQEELICCRPFSAYKLAILHQDCSTRLLHDDDLDDTPDPRIHRVRTILPRVPCVTTESLRPNRYWSLTSTETGTYIRQFDICRYETHFLLQAIGWSLHGETFTPSVHRSSHPYLPMHGDEVRAATGPDVCFMNSKQSCTPINDMKLTSIVFDARLVQLPI